MGEATIASAEADAKEPPPRPSARSFRPDIQGLRAVAVGMVVAFHAGLPIPGGFIGVDVFFVISGFVITAMLQREWRRNGSVRLGHFYVRRFRRLTPALALLVSVVLAVSFLVLSPLGTQQNAALTGVGAILLVANFVIARTTGGYFDLPAASNPLLNTWSLSVEEQFYLVFPILILTSWLVGRRWPRLRWTPTAVMSAMALGSFILAMVGAGEASLPFFPGQVDSVLGFYSPVGRVWEFALGALLAIALRGRRVPGARWGLALSVIGAVTLAVAAWAIDARTPYPGAWTLLPTLATAALILGGSASRANPVTKGLGCRQMVFVGDRSYSIYLWHWPVIVFSVLLFPGKVWVPLAAAAVSLAPAFASYRWVEQPLRRRRSRTRMQFGVLIAAVIIPPVALGALLWVGANEGFGNSQLQKIMADAKAAPASYAMGCRFDAKSRTVDTVPCAWGVDRPGAPIYLVGDSNAAHFTEALMGASEQLDRPLYEVSGSSCPLLDITIVNPALPTYATRCREHNAAVMTWLTQAAPGTVVIAASDEYWTDSTMQVQSADGRPLPTEEDRVPEIQAGLLNEVDALTSAGQRVVLLQTVPHFVAPYEWNPAAFSPLALLTGSLGQELPLQASQERTSAVSQAVTAVGQQTGAAVMDVSPQLCPAGTCSSYGSEGLRYRDFKHISVAESERLSGVFLDVLGSG